MTTFEIFVAWLLEVFIKIDTNPTAMAFAYAIEKVRGHHMVAISCSILFLGAIFLWRVFKKEHAKLKEEQRQK